MCSGFGPFLPLYLIYGLNFVTYYLEMTNIYFIWTNMTYYFDILTVLFGLVVFVLSSRKLFENIVKRDQMTLFLLFF